jgi:replicative DNA helicase Mcm|tara:strand:+ start:10367 stop:12787 length:2421 start_codon:yes stop_codon:yes gene_type:complete
MVIEDMFEEEVEMTADERAVHKIARDESKKMHSALAFIMYHSGYVYTVDNQTNSTMRGSIIDDNARAAMTRMTDMGYASTNNTLRAISSMREQIELSDKRNVPIFNIDIDAINTGLVLPLKQPMATTFQTPPEVASLGVVFRDYEHFRNCYNELASHIVSAPKSVLFWLQRFENLFLNIADPRLEQWSKYHDIRPEWRFTNPPDYTFRDFDALAKAGDIGKLVRVEGQIVEKGEVKTVLTHIAFRCVNKNDYGLECGTIKLIEQDVERGELTKPNECHTCSGKKYIRLDSQESKNEAMQRISLQPEDVSAEAEPIMVELRGDLCDSVEAGTSISVVGTMRLEPMTKNGLICSHYILASSIREKIEVAGRINLTEKDKEEVSVFEESVDLEEKMQLIIDSWAGHIHGHDDIKKAMVLAVVGAVPNLKFGLRPNFHILLIGDPGTAKSKLLELATRLAPGSRYFDASSATAAGLTGACVQQEDLYTSKKRWVVLPGEIPLTPEGCICAIDEFNLYKGDFGDVNTAMESGMVMISKVVKARLPVKASIIAGANPESKHAKRKKFNKMIPVHEQLTMDFALLSRFDQIFVIKDEANKDKDEMIAMAMLKGLTETDDGIVEIENIRIDLNLIHKFLEVAKKRTPKLSKSASEYIQKQHARKRSEAATDDELRSHRQVAALARLTIATAKFDGVSTATLKHVRFAEGIMAKTLQEEDPGAIDGGMSKEGKDMRDKIAETFVSIIKTDFMIDDRSLDEIYGEMKKIWPTIPPMDVVDNIMKQFSRDKATTNIHRSRSGVYTYSGTKNPAWQVW